MEYIILALATWRIANLLANEEGPFNVFDKLRERVGIWYDEDGEAYADDETYTYELGKWMLCVWCSSVAIGAVWALGYWIASSVAVWIALPFALSTVAVVVDSLAYEA